MTVIWRILGFQLVAELGSRLPPRAARRFTVTLLVVANLLPIVGVTAGWMDAADVFVAYWLETVVIIFFSVIRMFTATKDPTETAMQRVGMVVLFLLGIGTVTALHGVLLAMVLGAFDVRISGQRGWLYLVAGLFLSHLFSLLIHWFGRGERHAYTPSGCQWIAYPRVVVLTLVTQINVWVLLLLAWLFPLALVVVLVVLKVGLDVLMHLFEHLRASRAARPVQPAAAPA